MGDSQNLCLKKSNARLTMYNGTVMYHVGKYNLTCKKMMSVRMLSFKFLTELRPLLGVETCQKLNFSRVLVNGTVNTVSDMKQLNHS